MRIFVTIIILLSSNISFAQFLYGHEWINFDQTYYKIETTQDGLYRVEASSFPDFIGRDPKNLQLFFRGKEVAIHVNGDSDNSFDSGDYIDFFGKMNDGFLDSLIYPEPTMHVNEYRNIHSDTCAFFLTHGFEVGKRIITKDYNSFNYQTPDYVEKEVLSVGADWYWGRNENNNKLIESEYSYSEGFSIGRILTTDALDWWYYPSAEKVIGFENINNLYTSNSDIRIQIKLTNSNTSSHIIEVYISNDNTTFRNIGSVNMNGLENKIFSTNIFTSDILDGKTFVKLKTNTASRTTISWVKLTYNHIPTQFEASNLTYLNKVNSKIILNGTLSNYIPYNFTDFNTIEKIQSTNNSNTLQFNIHTSVNKCKLIDITDLKTAHRIKKINFRNIDPLQHNYLIISHNKLMQPTSSSTNPVKDYATYRASNAGGSYDTLTLEISQIINQYNYGEYSPLAIRKLANYLADYNPNFQHVFIIGHGIWYEKYRFEGQKELIPTWGAPPSDQLLTAGIGNIFIPRISVGRLSATKPHQISDYLAKVIEHEATSPIAPWKKNIMHIGGGKNKEFKPYLDIWANIAKGPMMGANVKDLHRNSISVTQYIPIPDPVNEGLAIINFLGHSSTTTLEFDVLFASNDIAGYRNKGKYTHFLANGCYSANLYGWDNLQPETSIIFDWVITPNRGAVTGMGNVFFGYPYSIHVYMQNFYKTCFQDSAFYGKGVGIIQKETSQKIFNNYGYDIAFRTQATQIPLQGDPAISYFNPVMPDYELLSANMSIEGFHNQTVTALSDSFKIKYVVTNFGKAPKDSLLVSLKRTYPNGITTIIDSVKIKPTYLWDTLYFKVLKEDNIDANGLNRLELHVDHVNDVAEYNEQNNIGVLEFLFPSRGITALLPTEYSIVGTNPVELVAQSNNLFIANTEYYFEIDTSHTFNSPLYESKTIIGNNLAIWSNPTIISNFNFTSPNDSVVFYWKVRFKNIPTGTDTLYGESSFIFIPNSPKGWSQSTFPQFKKDRLDNLNINFRQKKWEFKPLSKNINLISSGANIAFDHYNKHRIFLGNYNPSLCDISNTLHISLVNVKSLDVIPSKDSFYINQCTSFGESVTYTISNLQTTDNQAKLEEFIDNLPENTILVAISQGDLFCENIGASLKNKMATKLGATLFGNLPNGYPYALIANTGENGNGYLIAEKTADTSLQINPKDQTIYLDTLLNAPGYPYGKVNSTIIGPALDWGSVFYNYKNSPNTASDSFNLKVIGLDFNLNEREIIATVPNSGFDINTINADQYPFLKLEAFKQDLVDDLPPQLQKWQVVYSPAPEGIIDLQTITKSEYDLKKFDEGEIATYKFAFKNITDIDFKRNLIVRYTLTNSLGRGQIIYYDTLSILKGKETLVFEKKFNTAGLPGTNIITVFINPRLQPEQYYNNNALQFRMEVRPDKINPLMDVVFDGVRIMDGDIVSPTPVISIRIKDENKYFFKNDLSGVKMLMKYPTANAEPSSYKEINLQNNPQINFTPASPENNNELTIEYKPEKLNDGIHTLRMQGADANNNVAGVNDYEISFEVINKSSITNFYPYPNPFSTKCNFVFTLTGNDIPDNFKIQIMTVTGKVVREITKSEIGPIRIGNNKTAYAWDGTDEYGDKLGNGVYLYKVVMKNDDGVIEHRETAADKSFTKGWGKLYILR